MHTVHETKDKGLPPIFMTYASPTISRRRSFYTMLIEHIRTTPPLYPELTVRSWVFCTDISRSVSEERGKSAVDTYAEVAYGLQDNGCQALECVRKIMFTTIWDHEKPRVQIRRVSFYLILIQ